MPDIKKPKLDVCDFYKKWTTAAGKPIPPPEPDRLVVVFQKGMEIIVRCGAPIKGGDNYVGTIIVGYVGTIIELGAPSNEYDDLNVGDKIIFKIENIDSFNP